MQTPFDAVENLLQGSAGEGTRPAWQTCGQGKADPSPSIETVGHRSQLGLQTKVQGSLPAPESLNAAVRRKDPKLPLFPDADQRKRRHQFKTQQPEGAGAVGELPHAVFPQAIAGQQGRQRPIDKGQIGSQPLRGREPVLKVQAAVTLTHNPFSPQLRRRGALFHGGRPNWCDRSTEPTVGR